MSIWTFGANNGLNNVLSSGGFGSGLGYLPGLGGRDMYNIDAKVSDCATSDGNRTGICVRTTSECTNRGGRPLGTCFATPQYGSNQGSNSGSINSLNGWPQQPGIPVGICCFFQVTCGGTIVNNGTYFRNPNAPSPYTDSRACSVTVQRIRPDICQIRLDFLVFDLSRPREGTCDSDRFVVNGQTQNNIIPPICGYNTGQHIYIDMSATNSPVTLNVLTMANRNRLFDIRVSQIHCSSIYRAPPNCLQYHIGVQGSIRSFNYDEPTVPSLGGYLNNLDYTICFKKEPGFCTVTYSVPTVYVHITDQNQPQEGPTTIPPGRYFNIVPDTATQNPVGSNEGGAGPYDCPFDYLFIAGRRLCGYRFNGQLYPPTPNPMTNSEVTDNSTGPIYARFVSNHQEVGRGFNLNYRMNPCLIGG
ncbi:uncharacterized protein LOC128963602 [Oppia nitens]|uniref:uncharacterized protein LOC128963602 n=1 Tax=Oppia nitens TaxID=1686743 RepID=UPI0023DB128B|nr:uncharacterized protein LOC128963602 [Oppia nitens]